ncbi:MAG: ISAs1 family transposase [Parafilimonas sp.]
MSKKTTEAIINSGNDYLIGVKKNQPALYAAIEQVMADKNKHSSTYTTLEINKGRTELRHIMVSDMLDGISSQWSGLQQITGVHRIVKHKGKTREEMAYFISSQSANAFLYAEGIRSHWAIENSLHYVKDITWKEDESKIVTGNAPQNISTIKNIGINLFRTHDYTNMAQATRLLANDIGSLLFMIT